jgi:cellulose synthase/poly-beta-1,6-N-acetylglucosamine synthase-like glycosyltransferase
MQIVAVAAFLLGSGFILYTLVGYPILLWVCARLRPRTILKRFEARSVTVLLPVHNGEQWLREKLLSILSLDYPRDRMQILVLSDGSTDDTDRIAQQFAPEGIELLKLSKGGKARALNKGMARATGEILFFTDVRQRLAPDALKHLVSCFADEQVGGVCGELVILDGETQEEASVGLYWRIEKWIRRQLSAMGTLLVVTGCLYAIRRTLAEPIPETALGDDIFIPQSVLRKGYRVVFEDAARAYDYPTTHDIEVRRKIRTLAGLYQYVLRHGFGRHWFHFISYKVTRLILPYALICVAVSSLFLPRPWAQIAVAVQVFFYGLAAVDGWIPDRTVLKRISSPARTFCMLMAAAVRAVRVFFVPASELWGTTHVRSPKGS